MAVTEIKLKDVYKDYFKIGASIGENDIKTHKDIILAHFNTLTCENAMKFGNVRPAEDEYDFAAADKIYDFAEENGIPLRGHNFVWHQEFPEWMEKYTGRKQLLERLEKHIKAMAERYENIYCWDVVNEAVSDGEDYMRNTHWLAYVGDDYLEQAFELAHKHLGDKLIFYNDYNEFDPQKRAKIIKRVKQLLKNGAPISGIGLQCHLGLNFDANYDEARRSIEEYAKLGLKIQVTEMDVSLYPYEDREMHEKPTFEQYKKQTDIYRNMFKIFREYKDEIDAVTFWCCADDVTWLNNFPVEGRKNGATLFDEDHMPKECFYAICDF